MGRTLSKAKGRRGGEAERFAFIPESLLTSEAGRTLPHAALKVLAILVLGRSKERNGTMCCSESYAMKFGINSRATVRRSLDELRARGIVTVTRRVTPFMKHPTLYAVTWWPIAYRDGEPLTTPEEPTLDYLNWRNVTPMTGVETSEPAIFRSHPPRDSLTPIAGVENVDHHTYGDTERPILHTHHRGKSLYLGSGRKRVHTMRSRQSASDPVHLSPPISPPIKNGKKSRTKSPDAEADQQTMDVPR